MMRSMMAGSRLARRARGARAPLGAVAVTARALKSKPHPIWDEPELEEIFRNNRKWIEDCRRDDPTFFERLAEGQTPKHLLIGCSDSRVPAEQIMGLQPGELFVHRNVANQCIHSDMSFLTVLAYAVNVLNVEDVFVLGHYDCGGVKASCTNHDNGLPEHWVRHIRDVQRTHFDELKAIPDQDMRVRRLIELNVQEQCIALFCNSIVQAAQARRGRPRVHGFVFDVADGRLHKLPIDFKSVVKKYNDVYRLYDFSKFPQADKGAKE